VPPSRAFGRFAVLLAVLASPLSRAQEDGGVGETLEVSGERPVGSPQAPGTAGSTIEVARFSGEVRSAAELLAASPGATVHQSGAPGQSASLSLRGASAEESLVLMDGIPLQGPGGGSIDLSTLPAALLDRMIVSRGVLGAQLGAGALGGAVELVPRRATSRLSGGAQASMGSFGTAQLEGDVAADGALFGIQLDRTSGNFDYAARVPPESPTYYGFTRQNSDARRASGLFRLEEKPTANTELDLLLQATAGDRGLPGSATFSTSRSRALDQGGLAGARLHGSERSVAWAVRAWGRADRVELRGVQLTSDCADGAPDCPRSDERSSTARAEGELAAELGDRHWLRAVLSGGEEWIAGAPTGSHRRSLASLALSDDTRLPLAISLHPALRLDRVGGDTALSPGITATFRASGPLEFRAGWGLSFRPASFSELYLDQGGVTPNPTLAPERAWSADAGAAWRSPKLTVEANLFWSRYRELILYQLYAPFRIKPYNVGAARIAGLELQASLSLPHGFTAEAAYTFLDAVNQRSGLEGHHLTYRPPHQLFGRLARRGDRLEGYAGLGFRSAMPRDQFDSAHVPAQLRIDAGAGVRAVGPLWIDFEAKNLLDDQTQQDLFQYPLPGLSFALIARARL
jgi:iron complex outermembrane receptor protein